jgi:hypothetical protein
VGAVVGGTGVVGGGVGGAVAAAVVVVVGNVSIESRFSESMSAD